MYGAMSLSLAEYNSPGWTFSLQSVDSVRPFFWQSIWHWIGRFWTAPVCMVVSLASWVHRLCSPLLLPVSTCFHCLPGPTTNHRAPGVLALSSGMLWKHRKMDVNVYLLHNPIVKRSWFAVTPTNKNNKTHTNTLTNSTERESHKPLRSCVLPSWIVW